jgi:hypothetical protein
VAAGGGAYFVRSSVGRAWRDRMRRTGRSFTCRTSLAAAPRGATSIPLRRPSEPLGVCCAERVILNAEGPRGVPGEGEGPESDEGISTEDGMSSRRLPRLLNALHECGRMARSSCGGKGQSATAGGWTKSPDQKPRPCAVSLQIFIFAGLVAISSNLAPSPRRNCVTSTEYDSPLLAHV